jgi:hypothetical protein
MATRAERTEELVQRPELEGFKSTPLKPLPTFPCTHIAKSTGKPCQNMGVMGMLPDKAKCSAHGGTMPSVSEKALARVEAARMKIFGTAEEAADVLESLLDPGTGEAVRLKAATEVLDRAGIRAGYELDLSGDIQVNYTSEIQARLAKLALGQQVLEITDSEEADIQEAEIVEENSDE